MVTTTIRFDRPSTFGRVLVVDEGDVRYLRFGSLHGDDQSMITLSQPTAVPMSYIRIAMLGTVLAEQKRQALMIGLGGGTFATLLQRYLPKIIIDAVEINPVVVEAAKKFFAVRPGPWFRIYIADGVQYLAQTKKRYDLIMLDAYNEDDLPKHMSSEIFFQSTKTKLSKNGVVILNLAVEKEKERQVAKSFRSIFPVTVCVRCEEGENLLLFGLLGKVAPEKKQVVTNARRFKDRVGLSFDLAKIARKLRFDDCQ